MSYTWFHWIMAVGFAFMCAPLAQAADCSTPKRAAEAISTFVEKHYDDSPAMLILGDPDGTHYQVH